MKAGRHGTTDFGSKELQFAVAAVAGTGRHGLTRIFQSMS
jgi:hypothetical protein